MKTFVLVLMLSLCNFAVAKDQEKKRNYPGGRDEQDLTVQPQLQKASKKVDAHEERPSTRQPSSISDGELFNE